MNNPYRNGKVMSPQMTLLAMVYEAGARAALAEFGERMANKCTPATHDWLVLELAAMIDELPPPAPKKESAATL
jgi:hypothetical protein